MPRRRVSRAGKCSGHYCVARACVTGTLALDDCIEEARCAEPQTEALLGRVSLTRHEDAVTHTAYVTITATDGRQFHKRIAGARGSSPAIPLPEGLLEEKFLDCASRVLSVTEAQALYQRLLRDDFR